MRLTPWRPPSLRTVLLLSNLAVLVLPVAGLWAMRLYESALVRQTESELVAQAAVLAGAMRERMRVAPGPPPSGTPASPAAAALHLARRPGLDLARDPVLPPQPDDPPGGAPDPAAAAAGEALAPVLRDAQAITLSSLRLTDRAGVIVATTGNDLGHSLAPWPEVAAVLAGASVSVGMHAREPAKAVPGGISRTSGLRVFVALPVSDEAGAVIGAAVLSRTPNTVGSAIWGKSRALTEMAVLLLAGGALLAAGISRLVTRPLEAVVAQAQAVAAGGKLIKLARPGTREVAALSAAVARMGATLAQRAGTISGIAASISHEFKAPIAAITGAAELLEDHADGMSEPDRLHLLHLVQDGSARLDRLVGRLVDLARADMMRASPAPGALTDVAPILARLTRRYPDATVACHGDVQVAFGADALEAVVSGLLDNAAIHAPGAAVRIDARQQGGRTLLTVSDAGPGIPAEDAGRVFEPFFTTTRDRGGTGLGLPIARTLVAAAGGTITLGEGPGATFLIDLPADASA